MIYLSDEEHSDSKKEYLIYFNKYYDFMIHLKLVLKIINLSIRSNLLSIRSNL